jgi:HK97 family phage portal protein
MIASAAGSTPWKLSDNNTMIAEHPVLAMLSKPNPLQGGCNFFESVYAYKLIAGNAYIHAVGPKDKAPMELHTLRPDRVSVIAGNDGVPQGYRYTVRDSKGERYTNYPVDRLTGQSRVLHIKQFHPLNDWYGLSPIESAAYSIDQHNQAGAWNQALLQNGAKPSGALVVKGVDGQTGGLSEEQYYRVKQEIEGQFSGPANAGRPLLLEGGLDWKEMSMSPKDMDFIEAKHSSARDIALAFGVPPQLLGIPGDNTYSNLAEARLGLWEQTILPMMKDMTDALNSWLLPMFGNGLKLQVDTDAISALAPRREREWDKIANADFLSDEEKKQILGVGEV